MYKYTAVLSRCSLFNGMLSGEIERLLVCFAPVEAAYRKNEFILREGDRVTSLAVVLSGAVSILCEDYSGNRTIISRALAGDIFAEAYASVPGAALKVSAVAEQDTEIMFLSVERITHSCHKACELHAGIANRLLSVIAQKSLMLNEKLAHVTRRTIREKVLSYLSAQSRGRVEFSVPLNREQMADYLAVDRSALSAELARMKQGGIIDYRKNRFKLLTGRNEP